MEKTNDPYDIDHLRLRIEFYFESIRAQQEAAKQLLALGGFFQTLFFAAISLSDLKKVMSVKDVWYMIFVLLAMLTIVGWSACIYFASRVLMTRKYTPEKSGDDEDPVQQFFASALNYKQTQLRYALSAMMLSFIPLAMNILIYLVFVPQFPT